MTSLPAQPAPPPDEAQRQAALDSMKRRATMLLVGATIVFIVARLLESAHPWVGYIRATAEAAMVGGLADWFAVTALFRHPMGIPIPHTAIVPMRKDRVGQTLGLFVQRNFLTREVITSKLESLGTGRRLGEWLAEPDNARTVARQAASALANVAGVLHDEDVQHLIDRSIESRVRSTRVAPIVGRMLSLVTADDRHQELLNEAIALLAHAVEDNRDLIRERIERESPWWIPTAVDDKIYRKVISGIERTLVEIRDDPAHPLRERFDAALRQFIDNLQHSDATIARAEEIKADLLDAQAVRHFSSSLWTDLKSALIEYAERTEPAPEGGSLERALVAFGRTVQNDPAIQARVDAFVCDVAVFLVARYQDEVARLIADTVHAWDPEVTSRRVELAIGRDLQFIRINGTLVGGLAGLAIYALSRLIP